MRYEGYYDSLQKPIKSKSLNSVQLHIEKLGGYARNISNCAFMDHYTALILEYNFIGWQSSQYYFSTRENCWKKSPNKLTQYSSWRNAPKPIKHIAQCILRLSGHKSKEEDLINNFVQKKKIDELYGS